MRSSARCPRSSRACAPIGERAGHKKGPAVEIPLAGRGSGWIGPWAHADAQRRCGLMTDDRIRRTLRSFILTNFLPGEDPSTLEDSTLLISSGVIASLSMLELATFMESEF